MPVFNTRHAAAGQPPNITEPDTLLPLARFPESDSMITKTVKTSLSWTLKQMLPDRTSRALKEFDRSLQRAMRPVPWNDLRRLKPIAREFGYHRGLPVDRHFIESFLAEQQEAIHGRVLEIACRKYTERFGGSRVTHSDVLHVQDGAPEATIIGDLTTGKGIPQSAFDCIILTETLTSIYDVRSAVKHTLAALRPGGTALMTVSGISQISQYDMQRWGDYWRFTSRSLRQLLEEFFPSQNVDVQTRGNVLVATALLHGMVVQDLQPSEFEYNDPDYEVSILARAIKPHE